MTFGIWCYYNYSNVLFSTDFKKKPYSNKMIYLLAKEISLHYSPLNRKSNFPNINLYFISYNIYFI